MTTIISLSATPAPKETEAQIKKQKTELLAQIARLDDKLKALTTLSEKALHTSIVAELKSLGYKVGKPDKDGMSLVSVPGLKISQSFGGIFFSTAGTSATFCIKEVYTLKTMGIRTVLSKSYEFLHHSTCRVTGVTSTMQKLIVRAKKMAAIKLATETRYIK